MQTLTQFLKLARGNAWVRERGFSSLYVRVGARFLDGKLYRRVVDIANVTVPTRSRGKRRLTTLIKHLHDSRENIYVESVMESRLGPKLLGLGFTQHGDMQSYYLLVEDQLNA
jgi:hypothetical protein